MKYNIIVTTNEEFDTKIDQDRVLKGLHILIKKYFGTKNMEYSVSRNKGNKNVL